MIFHILRYEYTCQTCTLKPSFHNKVKVHPVHFLLFHTIAAGALSGFPAATSFCAVQQFQSTSFENIEELFQEEGYTPEA